MILNCEKCHTRYLLPTHLLGPDGRRVRCTICSHEWFQIPEEDEDSLSFSDTLAEELESVKYNEVSGDLPVLLETSSVSPEGKRGEWFSPAVISGMAAAAVIFVSVLAGLLAFREPVMRSWPASLAFYDALGVAGPTPGDGLIFEDLKAVTTFNAKGVEILSVDGKIMNIKPYPVQVPGLRFSLRTKDGEEVEHWSLESPKTDIPSQQSMPFSSVYPEIGENVTDLNISFVID